MAVKITRRATLTGLAAAAPSAAFGQPAASQPASDDYAVLDRPALFDVSSQSGNLKETVQNGQGLLWRHKDNPSDRRFHISNIAITFLRSETGGLVKMNFSGNVTSIGYVPAEEIKLNVIIRSKGGGALHSWSFGVPVRCGDKNQSITPVTGELPTNFAANVFTSMNTVEVAELSEPGTPGVKVQRCST
ncbi:MAG: hypothetical protein ACJ8F3_17555 [Xanthobacteraceae bacterium]